MRTLLASVIALGLMGSVATIAANAAVIGVHVGPVGVGIGDYYWHHHHYHHREWRRDHYRYW